MTRETDQDRRDEKDATRALLALGLELVRFGAPAMSESDIDAWLAADDEQPFPKTRHQI